MRGLRGERWSRRGLRLLSIRRIPIVIHPSWVVSVAVLAGFTAPAIAEQLVGGASSGVFALVTILAVLPISACIVVHELAHALFARAHGLHVSRITLFAIGGVSVIAGAAPTPAAEYAIAASGPIVSLIIASTLAALAGLGDPGVVGVTGVLGAYAWVNFALAVFNLIPAFPMDGGRVLRSVIWQVNGDRARATTWAARVGRALATLLIAGGLSLVLVPLGSAGRPDVGGLWTVVVGLFIFTASLDAERAEGDRR